MIIDFQTAKHQMGKKPPTKNNKPKKYACLRCKRVGKHCPEWIPKLWNKLCDAEGDEYYDIWDAEFDNSEFSKTTDWLHHTRELRHS